MTRIGRDERSSPAAPDRHITPDRRDCRAAGAARKRSPTVPPRPTGCCRVRGVSSALARLNAGSMLLSAQGGRVDDPTWTAADGMLRASAAIAPPNSAFANNQMRRPDLTERHDVDLDGHPSRPGGSSRRWDRRCDRSALAATGLVTRRDEPCRVRQRFTATARGRSRLGGPSRRRRRSGCASTPTRAG